MVFTECLKMFAPNTIEKCEDAECYWRYYWRGTFMQGLAVVPGMPWSR